MTGQRELGAVMTGRELLSFYCGVLVVLGMAGAMVVSAVMATDNAASRRVEWGHYHESK
ncbi:MAG: hypothetical protein ABL893_05925 [Hyphomicrobium sp.]